MAGKDKTCSENIFFQIIMPRKGTYTLESINKRKSQPRSLKWKFGLGICVTVLLLSINVSVMAWTGFIEASVFSLVALYEGGIVYNLWKSPAVPTVISIYPFNYTNLDKMYDGSEVPHVQEIGPYVYMEKAEKVRMIINENHTVTYVENRTHQFAPELSNGSLNDTIIAPNLAMIAGFIRENVYAFELAFLHGMSMVSRPFLQVSMKDFIWGYGDLLSDFLTTFKSDAKFGVLSNRIGLSKEPVTLHSGQNGKLGIIDRYGGRNKIGVHQDQCDKIDATDGSIFPREMITLNSTVYIYAKDICRRLPMVFSGEIITDSGLPAYRYSLPKNVFDPSLETCFCQGESCPPNGTFNTAPCNFGAPVVVSYPHFTHGDEALLEHVMGLQPDPIRYQSTIDVNNKLGVVLAGKFQMQIGILVKDPDALPSPLRKCIEKNTVLPIVWLELKMGNLTELLTFIVYHATYSLDILVIVLKYSSIVFIIISLYLIRRLLA